MDTIERLLLRIARYCSDHDIAESTFGRLAVNDGKLVTRLRDGKSIQLDTLNKIESALSRPPSPPPAEARAS